MLSTIGIRKLSHEVHWTDVWFYGVLPSALYLALGWVARAIWNDWSWCREGIAVVVTALLVLAIRNEWDLITWIAPRPDSGSGQPGYESVS
jgi:hypothetical protein